RLLPHDRVLEHLDALAEDGARVDDRRRVDLGAHAGTGASEACSCSSVRTTASPSIASRWSPGPRSTSSTKWRHSSRSGSSFATFGLKMSPVRVRHSPYVLAG